MSVDTGQASRCPLKRPATVRLEVVQKPYFSYYCPVTTDTGETVSSVCGACFDRVPEMDPVH